MAAHIGRRVRFYWNDVLVPGMREKTVSASGEAINVTDDDSSGWRELLAEAGINQVDVSGSGVIKGDMLREAWFNGLAGSDLPGEILRQAEGRIVYPDGGELTGLFNLVSYNETEPYEDASTFEGAFQSSGQVEYVAGAAPANTGLPAVIGTPQVGVLLTAYPGVWTGSPVYTYQWQVDDSGWENIVGATGGTYTPVVGQIGMPLRVIVTGTNSAGNASATSGPTADVLAAG